MKNLCTPKCQGMGLIDLMLAVIIASLLMAVAVPAYDQFIDRARVARAIGDIGSISIAIERFGIKNNGRLPKSLDDGIKSAAENNLDLAIARSTERSAERSAASSRRSSSIFKTHPTRRHCGGYSKCSACSREN